MSKRTYTQNGNTITVKHRVSAVHKGNPAPAGQKWLEFIHMQGFFKVGTYAMPVHDNLTPEQILVLVDMYVEQLNKPKQDDTDTKTGKLP